MSERPERIGDYVIEAELGAGGMATVYRARHAVLDTLHALKVLDPSYRARPEARQRFLDEARIQAKHLDHPNIVKVTNIVATADHAALVMELVDGGSLERHVAALRHRPAEIKRLMRAVLDAVGHAHAAGIIHRDLKPANVLVQERGGELVPKVTDFGIAKVSAEVAAKGKRSTHGDTRMGTLGYMSPEQVRRAKDVTPRSDIFSLGAMLYELATGDVPFGGESDYDVMENIVNGRYPPPAQVRKDVDPVIAAVIARALEADPAKRFASCAEMAAALGGEPARAATPATSPTSTSASPAAPASRRGALVIGGLVVAGLAFGAGALVVATRDDDSTRQAALVIDAETYASPPVDAAPPVDARVRRAVLTPDGIVYLDDIDAGSALAELRPSPPIDGGSSRLQQILGATTDAAPAPKNPCRGTWYAGGDVTIVVSARLTGECGNLSFHDRGDGRAACKNPITQCRVKGDTVTATYSCSYDALPYEVRSGTVTMTCANGVMRARTWHGTWSLRP